MKTRVSLKYFVNACSLARLIWNPDAACEVSVLLFAFVRVQCSPIFFRVYSQTSQTNYSTNRLKIFQYFKRELEL